MLLAGCANFRAYYNAYFNAEKAFKRADILKERRLKKNPLDSVDLAPEEKKQYERAIEKGSKVLELYGHKPNKYLSKSLFIMAESYLKLKEYRKAIRKYEELEKAYPKFEKMPLVQFHKAKCIFLSAAYPEARRALLDFIASTKNPKFKYEAMEDLAKLERENNSDAAGLAAYQELLKEKGLKPKTRALIIYECARLSFNLEKWKESREYATSKDIALLEPDMRYQCDFMAARCAYNLGDRKLGVEEMKKVLGKELYSKFRPETQIFLAGWYFESGNNKEAVDLLDNVNTVTHRSKYSAESYYMLGEYQLTSVKNEDKALENYDSSSVCGDTLEFALKSKERAKSLRRLQELRAGSDSGKTMDEMTREFYMAELFLFKLDNPDSAISHMNNIVEDTARDSTYSLKAAYARAYITDEFKKDKNKSDSLYKWVIENYPGTDYAKQAEYNMGAVPSIETDEDKAHKLFLEAEELNFNGYDLKEQVIPAFEKVIAEYPQTKEAAKAQFVIAMLYERDAENGEDYSLYQAKLAHQKLRQQYPKSDYYSLSNEKLIQAGIRPGDSIIYVPVESDSTQVSSDSSIQKTDSKAATTKSQDVPVPKLDFQEEEESEEVLEGGPNDY